MAVYAWSDSPKYPIMANGTLRFFRHPFMYENFFEGKTVFEKYYRGDCYEEVLEKKCSIINGVQPVDGK